VSKHALWQSRWQLEPAEGFAVHDSGLRVRLKDGQGAADNADDVVRALTPVHGAHNAPAMVQRLVREGAQLLIDPHSRGWRGGEGGGKGGGKGEGKGD
jgi:hypothetical protein